MAKKKSGGVGGFMFDVFNIGFTVFMFILPTIGLVYWYLYIRDPGGGQAPQVIVQEQPAAPSPKPEARVTQPPPKDPEPVMTSGFFSEGTAATMQPDSMESAPPKTKPAARKEYEVRTWTDNSGGFSVRASFYSVTGENVKLRTEEGRELSVPIARLSDADKEYVRAIFREKGIQPRF